MSEGIFKAVCSVCSKPKTHDYDKFHVVCDICSEDLKDCANCSDIQDLDEEIEDLRYDRDRIRDKFVNFLNEVINSENLEDIISYARKELRRID